MKKLKIVAAGWEGYTGHMGMVEFKNGVSVEPVPPTLANAISSSVSMVEYDEETGDEKEAGVASIMRDYRDFSTEVEDLKTMSEEDIENEKKDLANKKAEIKKKAQKIYTLKELENVADNLGLKGLREIGDNWGVKERSIPLLINKILTEQESFAEKQRAEKLAEQERVIVTGDDEPQETVAYESLKTEEQLAAEAMAISNSQMSAEPSIPVMEKEDVAEDEIEVSETSTDVENKE